MDPAVIGAASALAGVLLSGVLAYLTEGRADRRSSREYEARRLESLVQERREVFVEFLSMADGAWDQITRLRHEMHREGRRADMAEVAGSSAVLGVLAPMENKRQHLTLIADLDTRRAAWRLNQTLMALAADEVAEGDVLDGIEELQRCMRKSIGVGDLGGVAPLRLTPGRRWQRTARRMGIPYEP